MTCGVGCRRGSDPALLWPWRRLVAAAPIQPLAWEPPYAAGAAQEIGTTTTTTKKKKQKKQKKQCYRDMRFPNKDVNDHNFFEKFLIVVKCPTLTIF